MCTFILLQRALPNACSPNLESLQAPSPGPCSVEGLISCTRPRATFLRLMDTTDDDPFPLSLPRVLDTNMTEALEEHGLDFDPMLYDSQNFFSASYQSPHKPHGTGLVAISTGLDPLSTQSPESLPDSSSSGSSQIQHKRNHSAESSRSGALDEDVDTHMAGYSPSPKAIAVGIPPIEARVMQERSPSPDLDTSNRAMESHFDFDSAASSPNTYLDMMPNPTSIRPKMVPPRSSPNVSIANGAGLYSGRLKVSRPAWAL